MATGFVKVGWHPLAGTSVGPKAARRTAARTFTTARPAVAPQEPPGQPEAPKPPKPRTAASRRR